MAEPNVAAAPPVANAPSMMAVLAAAYAAADASYDANDLACSTLPCSDSEGRIRHESAIAELLQQLDDLRLAILQTKPQSLLDVLTLAAHVEVASNEIEGGFNPVMDQMAARAAGALPIAMRHIVAFLAAEVGTDQIDAFSQAAVDRARSRVALRGLSGTGAQ